MSRARRFSVYWCSLVDVWSKSDEMLRLIDRFDYPEMCSVNLLLTQILFIRWSAAKQQSLLLKFCTSNQPQVARPIKPQVSIVMCRLLLARWNCICDEADLKLRCSLGSFFLIVFFVLLNMIMAVIMGSYDEVHIHITFSSSPPLLAQIKLDPKLSTLAECYLAPVIIMVDGTPESWNP